MPKKSNAICQVCGTPYYICKNCEKLNSWKTSACSTQHFQIRQIYLQYRDKLITLKQATTMLSHLGEIDYSNFTDGYKAFFEMVYMPVPDPSDEVKEQAIPKKKKSTKPKTDEQKLSCEE